MRKTERIGIIFLYAVFVCYVIFMVKLLFLSRVSLSGLFVGHRALERSVNFIPLYSIKQYVLSGSGSVRKFASGNVLGNIIAFIPLGVYMTLFKENKKVLSNLLMIFTVSLSAETVQWLFGIGAADVDDLILNCLGGLIGILGYKLLYRIFKSVKEVRTAVTVLSVMGLPVLLYLLFMVKMRF